MNFSKLKFFNFRLGHKFGRKWAKYWPIFWQFLAKKNFEIFLVEILPKFSQKSTENRPISGPKKPAGLSGFAVRASGGLGLPKNRLGRAGFGLSPRPDPSLISPFTFFWIYFFGNR